MNISSIEGVVEDNYELIAGLIIRSSRVLAQPTVWAAPSPGGRLQTRCARTIVKQLRRTFALTPVQAKGAQIWVLDAEVSARVLAEGYLGDYFQEVVRHPMPGWYWLVYVGDYEFGAAQLSMACAQYVARGDRTSPEPTELKAMYGALKLPIPPVFRFPSCATDPVGPAPVIRLPSRREGRGENNGKTDGHQDQAPE